MSELTFLYKKIIAGVPNAFPDLPYGNEAAGNARINIFDKQIYSQVIPEVAPSGLIQDITWNSATGEGERWYDPAYPYIVNYRNVKLFSVNNNISFRYSPDFNTENILANSIPFNYDLINSSYEIILNDINGFKIQSNDDQYPWVVDNDAGYLYLTGGVSFSGNAYLTFWRYEGTKGLGNQGTEGPQGSTGETGATGEIGPQGTRGPQGITGPQGIRGTQGNTGFTGFRGIRGLQGDTGFTGLLGPQGNTGCIGFKGPQGNTGPQGSKGLLGNSGDIIGPTGPTGTNYFINSGSNIYYNSGYVGIGITNPQNSLDVQGNGNFTGRLQASIYFTTSDYRIKDNVLLLDETFSVDKLNPVIYYNKNIKKHDIGFIAHEVQENYPVLVNGEKDGAELQSLNYIGLIGILTKEIKELKKNVEQMNMRIKEIEKQ
jgi:hypothetical protein